MGKPLPGVDAYVVRRMEGGAVRIVDEPDVEGELALRADWPAMFRGYLNQEERYRKCFAGELYLTGDLAKRDAAPIEQRAGRIGTGQRPDAGHTAHVAHQRRASRCPQALGRRRHGTASANQAGWTQDVKCRLRRRAHA